MQKTGAVVIFSVQEDLPASDLERWLPAVGQSTAGLALGLNVSDLLQELFPFSEDEARLW